MLKSMFPDLIALARLAGDTELATAVAAVVEADRAVGRNDAEIEAISEHLDKAGRHAAACAASSIAGVALKLALVVHLGEDSDAMFIPDLLRGASADAARLAWDCPAAAHFEGCLPTLTGNGPQPRAAPR